MTNIDFGSLVSAVVNEMNCTTSELFGDERTDPDLAVKRYNRNVIGAIREAFDEAEAVAPASVAPPVPTCSNCGAPVAERFRFCARCGMPLTSEAADQRLADLLAEDVGMSQDDPRLREAIARVRKEMPEEWAGLVQKITSPVRPKNEEVELVEDLEDLVLLEIAVPRGWRDFLYAFPEWKDLDPHVGDSLTEELRGGMKAQLEMLLSEIHTSNPRKAVEYGRRYGLTNLYPLDHIDDRADTPENDEVKTT